MSYTRLAVTPSDPARREAVSAALFAAGAEGLLEDGAALVTVFADEADARAAERAACAADLDAATTCLAFDPGDWTESWRLGVKAREIGRLTVSPPWLAHEHDAARTIIIEPGTGFGTGEHESTRTALLLLQDLVQAGDVVADVGCGSGVLAIAAVLLGAARAAAIEIDPQAIGNAEENVARNGVEGRVTVIEGDAAVLLPLVAPIRLVVANIIPPVLVELLPVIERAVAPHGDVIVGGILVAERDAFAENARQLGWRVVKGEQEGEWWSGHLRRHDE